MEVDIKPFCKDPVGTSESEFQTWDVRWWADIHGVF